MQETTGTGRRAAARVASSEQQTAAATSAGNQTVSSTQQQKKEIGPTDQSVLDYLRKKGLGNAVLELTKVLKDKQDGNDAGENKGKTESNNNNNDSEDPQKEASGAKKEVSIRERIEEDEAVTRNQRTLLAKRYDHCFYINIHAWQNTRTMLSFPPCVMSPCDIAPR